MADTIILVPVLCRPKNVERLIKSVIATTRYAKILFLASPGKEYFEEHITLLDASIKYYGLVDYKVVNWETGKGDYAKKINYGVSITEEPYIFLGGDDIVFHNHWRSLCIKDGRAVVGTNDMGNPRSINNGHSTHTFVRREYVEKGLIDGKPGLLFEGYWHEYVDDELIGTAKKRGDYSFVPNAYVEHLHPHWNKGEMDDVYAAQQERMRKSKNLYLSRKRLWEE